MRSAFLLSILLSTSLILGSTVAIEAKAETRRQCVREVQSDFRACKKSCRTTKKDERLLCNAAGDEPLAECFQTCAADRDTCLEPVTDAFDICRGDCRSFFSNSKESCSEVCIGDCNKEPQYEACIDQAKIVKFECVVGCKAIKRTNRRAETSCSKAFQACASNCKNKS